MDQHLDWELVDANGEGLNFQLIYTNTLEVSQGDLPDKVKLKLNIDQFIDEFGQSLANDTILEMIVPRLIPSQEQAAAIKETGKNSE